MIVWPVFESGDFIGVVCERAAKRWVFRSELGQARKRFARVFQRTLRTPYGLDM
jgi:hypothetical protein